MFLVVDWRQNVLTAYASGFRKEGMAVTGFVPSEFIDWLRTASSSELLAIETFILGECSASDTVPEAIKRKSTAPIIALTDSRKLETTLRLFAAGADDVVEKPIHVRELLARAAAIRRRSTIRAEPPTGDIRVFADGRDPLVAGSAMPLPRRERRILEYLASNAERWAERGQIFSAIYGACEESVADKTVECHISKLRRKLRMRLGYDPIESRRFLGYRLARTSKSKPVEIASPQASIGQVSLSL